MGGRGVSTTLPALIYAVAAAPPIYTKRARALQEGLCHVMTPKIKNWRNSTDPVCLAGAVDSLKRDLERAYYDGHDDAGDLHDDLTSAEWRLRQAGRK